MPREVSFAQARAFVEALTGWEEVGVNGDGETAARPKSPHARTHLEAVLGLRCVPDVHSLYTVDGNKTCRAEVKAFIEYLEGVAQALRAGCGIEE